MWAVLLGTPASSVPRISALRILLIAWICYCVAVNTIFQSCFISFLVKPDRETQVASLNEILNSGMEYVWLKTKHRLLHLHTQSVPRCKHFSTRL
jgi:hypothetical protein